MDVFTYAGTTTRSYATLDDREAVRSRGSRMVKAECDGYAIASATFRSVSHDGPPIDVDLKHDVFVILSLLLLEWTILRTWSMAGIANVLGTTAFPHQVRTESSSVLSGKSVSTEGLGGD